MVARPKHAVQPRADFDNHFVCDLEPEIGVDGAEIVNAGEKINAATSATLRIFQEVIKARAHIGAIKKTRQIIVRRKPGEFFLALLVAFDRAENADQAPAIRAADPAAALFNPLRRAIRADEPVFAPIALHRTVKGRFPLSYRSADNEARKGFARLRGRIAKQAFARALVRPEDRARSGIEFEKGLRRAFGRRRHMTACARV